MQFKAIIDNDTNSTFTSSAFPFLKKHDGLHKHVSTLLQHFPWSKKAPMYTEFSSVHVAIVSYCCNEKVILFCGNDIILPPKGDKKIFKTQPESKNSCTGHPKKFGVGMLSRHFSKQRKCTQ